MKNAILKSISATNFGPFNGTITFDMETSVPKGQIIDNHTFIAGDNQQFNKIAYIYMVLTVRVSPISARLFCRYREPSCCRLSEHQTILSFSICFH